MNQQIAIVTGAAGGFGTAISRSLLDIGYFVLATDVDVDGLAALESTLGESKRVAYAIMDVVNHENVNDIAENKLKKLDGKLTLLVNNAGVVGSNFCLSESGIEDAKRIFDINLLGSFNCTAVFSKIMARQRYGRIINIASIAGIWGASGASAYAASKAGLISATHSWARELGPMNVVVTAVAPGICHTPMLGQYVSDGAAESQGESRLIKSRIPIGRLGKVDDVAEVVSFLATCKTNYITSAIIELDGGMRIGQL